MASHKFGMHSLHVKSNTKGTSNEISFSVLDAKKNAQDQENARQGKPLTGNPLGKIALFSLSGTKKVKGAPTREEGLPLSDGGFAPSTVEQDPTGTTTLGTNAISGGTISSGFSENVTASIVTPGKGSRRARKAARGGASVAGLAGRGRGKKKGRGATNGAHTLPAPAGPAGALPAPAPPTISTTAQALPSPGKKRGRVLRRVFAVGAACALVAAAAFGVYTLAQRSHEDYLFAQSNQQVLTSALAEVVEADTILSQMDDSFSDMLGEESLAAMKTVQGELPTAQKHLDEAESLVGRVQDSLTDEKDIAAAQNTLDAITARRTMITLGSAMIEETLLVAEEREALNAVWDSLIDADSQVRTAVSSYSPLDSSTLASTKELAQQAQESLEQVKTKIAAVKETYPDLVLSSYTSYINLRIEALDHLIASCDAVEVEDIDLATEESNEYNSCDSRAVTQADAFPADITTLATTSYAQSVQEFESEYKGIVTRAATLDTELREYLRTTSS